MRTDADKVLLFRDVMVNSLEDVESTLPAIIPQSESDEKVFKEGIYAIRKLIYHLRNADNVRELSRYLDVERIDKDFTESDIREMSGAIMRQSRKTVNDLVNSIRYSVGEDDNEW